MAATLNKVEFIGNLGKDPKVATLTSGTRVVSFSMAMTESWKDKNTGEKKERTEWANIVVFNEDLGKVAEQYLKKGSKVFIEGEFRTRKYQAPDGSDRWATEVVVPNFGGKLILLGDARGTPSENDYGARPATGSGSTTARSDNLAADLDDDIPF